MTKHSSPLPKFILLVVLLLILAALGVWAYNTYSSTKKSNTTTTSTIPTDSTQSPTNSPTQTPTDKQIFKIPELGIQMTLPAGLEGLEYEVDKDKSDGHLYAVFMTSRLREKNRGADGCMIGMVQTWGTENKGTLASNRGPIKGGQSYYYFVAPQQPCPNVAESEYSEQSASAALLMKAFDTLSVIE
jgi:hypothetical protein